MYEHCWLLRLARWRTKRDDDDDDDAMVNNIVAGTAVAAMAVSRLMRSTAFDPKRWTDRKREVVQKSWKALLLNGDVNSEEIGIAVFRRFFERHPAFLQLFTFRDQPAATFFMSAQVRLHVGTVVATLSQLVDQLESVEAVEAACFKLGKRHKKYKVKRGHYKAFGEAITDTLAQMLGDKYDWETKQAWEEVMKMIFTSMQKGAAAADS